jgi:hypothetical protein|nr:hypothetical protein Q903MT_gene4853 [Picea sitchensis]
MIEIDCIASPIKKERFNKWRNPLPFYLMDEGFSIRLCQVGGIMIEPFRLNRLIWPYG